MKQEIKAEIRAILAEAAQAGIQPGLERIRALLAEVDQPQQHLNFIHIAGTNGKGSFGCYCNAILATAGFTVGWFSTPHLVEPNESVRITRGPAAVKSLAADPNHGQISDQDLLKYLHQLQEAVRTISSQGIRAASQFELMTALALLYFRDQNCDFVVWETGLGGLEDASNVIEKPLALVITALGRDHVNFLGDDLETIAQHKAGIIKHKAPVWLYDPQDAVSRPAAAQAITELFTRTCSQLKSELTIISSNSYLIRSANEDGQLFCLASNERCYRINSPAVFLPQLAVMAIAVCRYLLTSKFAVFLEGENNFTDNDLLEQALYQGLQLARWPARFEYMCKKTNNSGPVILDGAHNPQACRALAESLEKLYAHKEIIFLLGFLADKDTSAMLEAVLRHRNYFPASIICTQPLSERALSAKELAAKTAILLDRTALTLPSSGDNSYNKQSHVFYTENLSQAVRFALECNKQDRVVCIFGSLYLAGPVRTILQKETRCGEVVED